MSERILRSRTRTMHVQSHGLKSELDNNMSRETDFVEVQNFINTIKQKDRKRQQERRVRRKRVMFSPKAYTSDDLANGDALKSFDPRDGSLPAGILKRKPSFDDGDLSSTPFRSRSRRRTSSSSSTSSSSPLLSALSLAVTPVSRKKKEEAQKVAEHDESVRRSFEFYRESGEWWNTLPKTDYTYSKFSTHRREVSPGVMAVPNMSRVGIGGVSPVYSPDVYSRHPIYHAPVSRQISFDSDSDELDASHVSRANQRFSYQRHNFWHNSWRRTTTIFSRIISLFVTYITLIPSKLFGEKSSTRSYSASVYTSQNQRKSFLSKIFSVFERMFSSIYRSITRSHTLLSDSWVLSSIKSMFRPGYGHRKRRLWLQLFGILGLILLAWWYLSSDSLASETSTSSDFVRSVIGWIWSIISFPWTLIQTLYKYLISLLVCTTDLFSTLFSGAAEAQKGLFSFLIDSFMSFISILMSLLNMIFAFTIDKVEQQEAASLNDLNYIKSSEVKAIVDAAVREREAALLSRVNKLIMAERVRLEKKELGTHMNRKLDFSATQENPEFVSRVEFESELREQERSLKASLQFFREQYDNDETKRDQDMRHSRNIMEKGAENMAHLERQQSSLIAQLKTIQQSIQEASFNREKLQDDWLIRANILSAKVSYLQGQLQRIWRRVGACCGQAPFASTVMSVQNHVRAEVTRLFSSPEGISLLEVASAKSNSAHKAPTIAKEPSEAELRAWVTASFVNKESFDQALANLTLHFYEEFDRRNTIMMSASAEEINAKLSQHLNLVWDRMAEFRSSLSVGQQHRTDHAQATASFETRDTATALDEFRIRRIVDSAIALYDADKTGMADFALESQGGQVVSTRCTETYQVKSPTLSVFGVPLWYPSNSPRTVIQPGMHPGECWAFVGSQGFLVIQLSHRIKVKGFTYEHISPVLLPTGKMDSAPKEFSVYGLNSEVDMEPILLGNYVFLKNSTSLQFFPVQHFNAQPVQLIEIEIKSNHGHINYTCLYRFRVHGTIA